MNHGGAVRCSGVNLSVDDHKPGHSWVLSASAQHARVIFSSGENPKVKELLVWGKGDFYLKVNALLIIPQQKTLNS